MNWTLIIISLSHLSSHLFLSLHTSLAGLLHSPKLAHVTLSSLDLTLCIRLNVCAKRTYLADNRVAVIRAKLEFNLRSTISPGLVSQSITIQEVDHASCHRTHLISVGIHISSAGQKKLIIQIDIIAFDFITLPTFNFSAESQLELSSFSHAHALTHFIS